MKVLISAAALLLMMAVSAQSSAFGPSKLYFDLSGGGYLEWTSFDGSTPDWTVCHTSSIGTTYTYCEFLNTNCPSNTTWKWSPSESSPSDDDCEDFDPDFYIWMEKSTNYTFQDEDLICSLTWPGVPVFTISLEVSPTCS